MPHPNSQWIVDSEKCTACYRHSELTIQFEGHPDSSSFGIANISGDKSHSHMESLSLVREGTNAFRQAFAGQQAGVAPKTPNEKADGPKIKVKKRRRLA